MGSFILRRLVQSVFTVFGVMLLTFLLFRQVAGDIASAHTSEKAGEEQKAAWRKTHGYDRPLWINVHNRLRLVDLSEGDDFFKVDDANENSDWVDRLAMVPDGYDRKLGRYTFALGHSSPLGRIMPEDLRARSGKQDTGKTPPAKPEMKITVASGKSFVVDLDGCRTCGDLIDRINQAGQNRDPKTGKRLVVADIACWSAAGVFRSQFFDHLWKSATFQAVSLKNNKKLTKIIAERAPYSLALMIPVTMAGWLLGMAVASIVAYYRGTLLDKCGVFLSVLGMCIPMLAFLIYGQLLMFEVAEDHAYGLAYRANIYVPVVILIVGSLGGSVRFYRTIILDETQRDYVRTARAKGASVASVLFKHVLKNCMLPILTSLVVSIPFLIMGSLLAESIFGIPGLGDLMLSSFQGRDEPVLNGLVFLTAVVYTLGLLITDISYAVFDPRIRLR